MPSYILAKKKIVQYIKENDFKSGDRLDSEEALSKRLGISRLLLREAMNTLKNDGIVYSIQGKGTFVAGDADHISNTLNFNTSISEMIESVGCVPGVKAFSKELRKTDEMLAKRFNMAEGSDILLLSRVRTADGKPVVHSTDYIAPVLTGHLMHVVDENFSLYDFIENYCHIPIRTSEAEIFPAVCSKEMAELLDYKIGAPLLGLHQLVMNISGEPLIWAEEYLRPDCFRFYINRNRIK